MLHKISSLGKAKPVSDIYWQGDYKAQQGNQWVAREVFCTFPAS